ncbi:hypothetical protein AAFF_G00032210 [Aldrovandia affinis]|uniref:Uncharacterized protein n=1 Tax=Aldrovandia affinis TaxID=143900 RepID=A0AAD7WFW2_9TELE|nr:hypothetical protein AAFF_G00032210 [Aldrovandia affinis]
MSPSAPVLNARLRIVCRPSVLRLVALGCLFLFAQRLPISQFICRAIKTGSAARRQGPRLITGLLKCEEGGAILLGRSLANMRLCFLASALRWLWWRLALSLISGGLRDPSVDVRGGVWSVWRKWRKWRRAGHWMETGRA